MKGRIVALDFGEYLVDVDTKIFHTRIGKTIRKKQVPIVGDYVELSPEGTMILSVYPRTTWMQRPRLANLDVLVIVNSLAEPSFSLPLLMMFMTFASYYHIPQALIFSKVDLGHLHDLDDTLTYLNQLDLPLFFFNKKSQEIDPKLFSFLAQKTVAFAGQTGVGKSSIINAIYPDVQRQIGSYSNALGRGRHETKEVRMVRFLSGFLVDTPGFSSIILPTLKHEFATLYPGFSRYTGTCKFSNCLHFEEPGCKIRSDVAAGFIPESIYETYRTLLLTCADKKEYAS